MLNLRDCAKDQRDCCDLQKDWRSLFLLFTEDKLDTIKPLSPQQSAGDDLSTSTAFQATAFTA